ncbi:hypothetical protein [Alkalicoccus luteus]|uniref:Uncharacterized protein n=1 Tax=Alkalicoccus luteus TaxID=1237094 RepID=A0A969TUK9_9BACI|nr:hypothetical protein [Alkalicoccus luteus]NJP37177.1 hypothetical protein [Alkalicoccus luteus]
MREIKSIRLTLPMDGTYWEVGRGGITEIEAITLQYPSSIEFIYKIYKDGAVYQTLINAPVEITFKEVEDL